MEIYFEASSAVFLAEAESAAHHFLNNVEGRLDFGRHVRDKVDHCDIDIRFRHKCSS